MPVTAHVRYTVYMAWYAQFHFKRQITVKLKHGFDKKVSDRMLCIAIF